jgi:hypothetical protein
MTLTRSTPICVKCKVIMKCHKNAQFVQDPTVGGFPSTVWSGDVWKCPGCSCKVVTGFGSAIVNGVGSVDVLEFKWDLKSPNENEGE